MANACFHCGLPIPGPARFRAAVLGEVREFCCAGCAAVASTIVESGFESYYQSRTSVAAPPPLEPAAPVLPAEGRGNEAALILERVRCAACLWLIERAVRRIPGVIRAEVNYTTQRAHVRWDPALASLAGIVEAIRAVGYDAVPYAVARQAASDRRESRASLWRLFVAGFGAMQVMMYAFPAYVDAGAGELSAEASQLMRWASFFLTLPVMLFSCGPFFCGALQELRAGRLGLDAPIALGLAGAFAASTWATFTASGEVYFDSVSMLVFLILGARYVQAMLRRGAAGALDRLYGNGASGSPAVGSQCVVAPGARIPADGVVLDGASSADESLLTGESRAVPKRPGDEVMGGSVNLDQPLAMRVTRTGADTRAAMLAQLVERAAALKPALVEAADRAAQPLTLVVLAVAIAAFYWTGSFWNSVAVLVVTCPCALALATPVVLARVNAFLLERGVLVTRSSVLEPLAKVTDVVFDKTGTLTQGAPCIARTATCGMYGEPECLALAATLEAASRHPIARAFWKTAGKPAGETAGTTAMAADESRYFAGRGVEGRIGGRRLRLGAPQFCREIAGGPNAFGKAAAGVTRICLAGEGQWLAAFDLEDRLRPDAAMLVAALRKRGLRVHLLSGDADEAVRSVASSLGMEVAAGGMKPEGKLGYLRKLQQGGRIVAMVGDGMNDAPVLAAADASVAMGGGADLAQLNADMILQGEALMPLLVAMDAAESAMRLVRQSIGWALAYNAIALPLAAAGLVGPLEAALGMGASSIAVLLNAMRPLSTEEKGSGPLFSWKASTS